MPGDNKDVTYLSKLPALSCRFVEVCVTFLLPSGIKGLVIKISKEMVTQQKLNKIL